MYSPHTPADRAEMLRAIGCSGSEITRKYLPRSLEDDGYSTAPGTTSCALHFAQFLWAVEQGAIGGGRGRGLIRAYMAMDETAPERFAAGLPPSATIYSKTGTWDIFTSQAAIIEDGPVHLNPGQRKTDLAVMRHGTGYHAAVTPGAVLAVINQVFG